LPRSGGLRWGRVWGMLYTARSDAWPPSARSCSATSSRSKAVSFSTDCRLRSRRNEVGCTCNPKAGPATLRGTCATFIGGQMSRQGSPVNYEFLRSK
jgi:hypothetical protein